MQERTAWWGFVIIGLLVGWMRAFFCIFALDSAEVQSKIAIFLHKLGESRLSKWLYQRALTIR